MQPSPINVYTSDSKVQEFRPFVNQLSENLEQPVQLRGLSELPAPDTQRPTRQQLRAERITLTTELQRVQDLLTLSKPHPRLATEVDLLEQDVERLQGRIQEINAVLREEVGNA